MWEMLNVWEELHPGGCFESRDFKCEPMSLCEHNLWPGPRLILKSNIRAILIIQMSENGPETFIMDCFVLPRSQDTCNNVYHHETHRHKQTPSLLHRTKATDLLRTCVIAVFSLDNVNPLSVSSRWLQRRDLSEMYEECHHPEREEIISFSKTTEEDSNFSIHH